MTSMIDIMKKRRSVRAFDGSPVPEEVLRRLEEHSARWENPFHVPVTVRFLDTKKDGGSSAIIVGTDCYAAGKVCKTVPYAREAFGYSFEKLLLQAQEYGLGTVWLAGTLDRKAFEKTIGLKEDEVMPAISPLGYPAEKMSVRESLMRKGVKADQRLPFETLFYDGSFDKPLLRKSAGKYETALEMVRWAPSAVNKQPWRIVKEGNCFHFYRHENKAYSSMQKIDMGIAMVHFELALNELGITGRFVIKDPGFASGEAVYTVTFEV